VRNKEEFDNSDLKKEVDEKKNILSGISTPLPQKNFP